MNSPISDVAGFCRSLSPEQRAELVALDMATTRWRPLIDIEHPERPTPQRMGYDSLADIVLFGGAAGGGKSDLLLGLAQTAHRHSLILRREAKMLTALIDRLGVILGTREGWNGQRGRWTVADGRVLDLGGCKDPGDELSWQGSPHDLVVFDEVSQFLESQFRFLITWNRSIDPGQRCRVVAASNPPTTAEGEWVKRFWAPWLDPSHKNPARPGELRWFVMTSEGDREVEGPEPIEVDGETLIPRSRTFIPSCVEDNPFLRRTGYAAVLQALPEPLRSQMLKGDFVAGGEDDPWQVVPTPWIRLAQERWQESPAPRTKLDAVGVDPSRGGRDETVIAKRFGDWFAPLVTQPGAEVPDGPAAAALVVANLKDGAPAFVDLIGIGSSVYDHLKGNNINAIGVNSAEASHRRDKSGKLGFANKRSEMWWRMREALEPDDLHALSLPPDPRLLADLAAPRWRLTARGIQVETKVEIARRLGRSTDRGDAVVYALCESPRKGRHIPPGLRPTRQNKGNYSPLRHHRSSA